MRAQHLTELILIGDVDRDLYSVAFPHDICQVVRLLRHAASIDREDPNTGINFTGHVQDYHPLRLEASADRRPAAVRVQGPADYALCALVLIEGGRLSNLYPRRGSLTNHRALLDLSENHK